MTRLSAYRTLKYRLPDRIQRWELDGPGFDHLRLVEAPRPVPRHDEVAFRMDVNVLCFSDVKIIRQAGEHTRLRNYDVARDKVVPGHEMSFTLTAVGRDLKDKFQPGQRWTVQPDMAKYHPSAIGYDIWGGLTQFGVFGPKVIENLLPVTADVGYSAVALSEPWACVEASYRRADLAADDEVYWLVGGAGPMGQMHLMRAIARKQAGGCPKLRAILVTDISTERLADVQRRHEAAAKMAGITLYTLNTTTADLNEFLARLAPNGIDYAVALAPVPAVVEEAMRRLRPYGVMNVFAGLKRGTGNVSLGDVHYDSLTLTGNSGSAMEDIVRCLNMVLSGELNTDAAVGAVAGLRAAREGLEAVAAGTFSNKVAIYPPLPNLPLTRVEDLPGLVSFPDAIAAQLRDGRWSRAAEDVLLEQQLELEAT